MSFITMSKHIDKLKKQLLEIAEIVNSFKSEAVQVKIIDKIFEALSESEKGDVEGNGAEFFAKKGRKRSDNNNNIDDSGLLGRKKPGATKVLNQLLITDFFDMPQSISAIAEICKDNFDSDFKTSELSGILLKLAKENKLRRERNDINNRFEYVKAG
jgi:hypothetical protein